QPGCDAIERHGQQVDAVDLLREIHAGQRYRLLESAGRYHVEEFGPSEKSNGPLFDPFRVAGLMGPQSNVKIVQYVFPVQHHSKWRDLEPALANEPGFLQHLARNRLIRRFARIYGPGGHFQRHSAERRTVLFDEDEPRLAIEHTRQNP